MTAKTDDELVEAYRAGDDSAAEMLFARYSRKMAAIGASRRLDGLEDADKAQIARIALLKAIQHYRPDGGRSFQNWAERLIQQAMVSAFRKVVGSQTVPSRLQVPLDAEVEDGLPISETIGAADEKFALAEQIQSMSAALHYGQALAIIQHLRAPCTTPFGKVFAFWLVRRPRPQNDVLIDCLDPSPMLRCMRFGTWESLFESCGSLMDARLRCYWADQRLLIKHLADLEPLGREQDDVDEAILGEIRRHFVTT